MRIRLVSGLVAVALALAACGGSDGGGGSGDGGTAAADAGDTGAVPEVDLLSFQAETVDGQTIDVGDYAGSDLVLWFWAPW